MKIEKLLLLPWYYRLAIFVGVASVIFFGFRYFVTSGTREETRVINDQISVLLPKNAQAQIASQRLNEFRAAYKARQEEYDELKALLPEQRELTSVLQGVQDRASMSRISMQHFLPKEDIQQDFYSGKPIEVEVKSSFNNLRNFFDQMARYQRIVSITDFKINSLSEQSASATVNSQFTLTAYYVSAEKLQQKTANPTQPAAPAAAPAK